MILVIKKRVDFKALPQAALYHMGAKLQVNTVFLDVGRQFACPQDGFLGDSRRGGR